MLVQIAVIVPVTPFGLLAAGALGSS